MAGTPARAASGIIAPFWQKVGSVATGGTRGSWAVRVQANTVEAIFKRRMQEKGDIQRTRSSSSRALRNLLKVIIHGGFDLVPVAYHV